MSMLGPFDELERDIKAAQRKSEVALTDLPHPFLKRITQITFGEDEPTEEQLNQVRQVLTCLAHFDWPGDMNREVTKMKPLLDFSYSVDKQALQAGIDYICTPIPAGSPITPPTLRQGVIPTTPRS